MTRRPRLRLAPGGVMVTATGLAILGAGVIASLPVMALWGQVLLVLVILGYPLALRSALAVNADRLELTCRPPSGPGGGGVAGSVVSLRIGVRNASAVRIGPMTLEVATNAGVSVPGVHALPGLGPGATETLELRLEGVRVGPAVIHGTFLVVSGPLGLYRMSLYRPVGLEIRVLPRTAGTRGRVGAPRWRPPDRDVPSSTPHPARGLGSDIRELREHAPGDPFKHIAWKASARRGKLIVKEFESESNLTVYALLDIGPSMRWGPPGATRLDRAIDICFHLARTVVARRDRFGLVTFDRDVFGFTRAGAGHAIPRLVVEHLLELNAVVHEDFTDIDHADLVARVAEFLAVQEHVDLSLPDVSGLGSAQTIAYDEGAVLEWVAEAVAAGPRRSGPSPLSEPAGDPRYAALRRFCRLKGIDLPYRTDAIPAPKEKGIARAVQKVIEDKSGPHALVLISDLAGVASPAGLVSALRLAQAHRHRVTVLRAEAPLPGRMPEGSLEDRLSALLAEDRASLESDLATQLRSAGVPVRSVREGGPLPRL